MTIEYAPSKVFITVLMALIGSGLMDSSVAMIRTMISESVEVRNAQPSDCNLVRMEAALTISPLWAKARSPSLVVTVMGWQFSAQDEPEVE